MQTQSSLSLRPSPNYTDTRSWEELVWQGVTSILVVILEAEAEQYLERHRDVRDAHGRALVVRNGKAKTRKLKLGPATLELRAPRVNDRRPGRRFSSAVLPPYLRRAPQTGELLPPLYLLGLSTGDFQPIIDFLLTGSGIADSSLTTRARLAAQGISRFEELRHRDLSDRDYAQLSPHAVRTGGVTGDERATVLVVVGITREGKRDLLAVERPMGDADASWTEILARLKRRGLKAPRHITGDPVIGFRSGMRAAWPNARVAYEQGLGLPARTVNRGASLKGLATSHPSRERRALATGTTSARIHPGHRAR